MKITSALQDTSDLKKNWSEVQLKLKETYGVDVFKSWIQNVEAKEINHNSLTLIVKTRFVRDWIVSHYADKILDFFQKLILFQLVIYRRSYRCGRPIQVRVFVR